MNPSDIGRVPGADAEEVWRAGCGRLGRCAPRHRRGGAIATDENALRTELLVVLALVARRADDNSSFDDGSPLETLDVLHDLLDVSWLVTRALEYLALEAALDVLRGVHQLQLVILSFQLLVDRQHERLLDVHMCRTEAVDVASQPPATSGSSEAKRPVCTSSTNAVGSSHEMGWKTERK